MLAKVRHWLESEGSARLQTWHAKPDEWVTVNRAGFRRAEGQGTEQTYYLLPETFDQEICTGFDPRQVAQLLASLGALKRPKEGNRLKCKERLPEIGLTWCYVVLPSIWQAVPGDAEAGA